MAQITIYTDGSALGNPGPGGYGAVLLCDTGSFFDDWQNLAPDENIDQLLSYTSLPFDMAADLLRREIRRDGGIEAHLHKHLTRMAGRQAS